MLCVPCMLVWQSVLCDQEHTFTLEVDMALLSVSRLTCGTCMVSRVEYCVDIVFADSAHCVSVVGGLCMFLTRVASSCRME